MNWFERMEYYRDQELEQLSDLRRQAGNLGIRLSDFYSMDLRELLDIKYGVMQRRENDYNNFQSLMHSVAGKIAQAVWSSKDFKKPFKKVNWTDGIVPEDKKKKRKRGLQSTIDRIEKQYGVKLTEIKEESRNG